MNSRKLLIYLSVIAFVLIVLALTGKKAGWFGKSNQSDYIVDFSNESKSDTLRSKSGYDAFIAKYDKSGNRRHAKYRTRSPQ